MPTAPAGRTIASELSRGLAVTIVVVVVLAAAAIVLTSRANAEALLRDNADRWTEQLAEVSALHVWNVDPAGLANACQAVMQPPDVLGARIFDVEGRVLSEVTRSEQPPWRTVRRDVYHVRGGVRSQRLGSVEVRVGNASLVR